MTPSPVLVLYLVYTGPCLSPGMCTFCVSFWERQSFYFFSHTMNRFDLGRQASYSSLPASLQEGYFGPLEQWTPWEPSRALSSPLPVQKRGHWFWGESLSSAKYLFLFWSCLTISFAYSIIQSLFYSLFCHLILPKLWEPAVWNMLLHLLQDHFWVHCSLQHSVLCWNPYMRPSF